MILYCPKCDADIEISQEEFWRLNEATIVCPECKTKYKPDYDEYVTPDGEEHQMFGLKEVDQT